VDTNAKMIIVTRHFYPIKYPATFPLETELRIKTLQAEFLHF